MGKQRVLSDLPFKDYSFDLVRNQDYLFFNLITFLPFKIVFQTLVFNI